jgi:hypothetical protein
MWRERRNKKQQKTPPIYLRCFFIFILKDDGKSSALNEDLPAQAG